MAARPPFGVRQLVHLYEGRVLETLEHQLGDALTSGQAQRLGQIMVDDDHFDLTAVARVNGARGVHQAETGSGSKARPRVDECGVALRQRDRDSSRQYGALPWPELEILGRHDVGTGIAGQCVGGQRQLRVQPSNQDP